MPLINVMRFVLRLAPLSCLLLTACTPSPNIQYEKGKALALVHCGSCHLPVSPELLDKETWAKHVLPAMAPRLGIGVWRDEQYYPTSIENAGPIGFDQWMEIVDYYKALAPDSLIPPATPKTIKKDFNLFTIKRPVWKDTTEIATTTMVSVNPYNGIIYSSGGEKTTLQVWDQQLNSSFVKNLDSPGADMNWHGSDTVLLTTLGSLVAVDAPSGTLMKVTPGAGGNKRAVTIATGLPRPVQSVAEDFNKDGRMDYLVCGFGHNYGGLFILQPNETAGYERKIIWEVPGAIHAVTKDFNGDGWPDVMALFAYGDEGIWLFFNDQKGGFNSRNVLRFPPVYGSTSFQVVDWNNDQEPDILFTAGDNDDFSRILKPYHGVYVYINKGDFHFELAYSYPVNGATKAIAADFDGDGDLDIAAIAFFADLKHRPEEKFIYFEQTSSLQFVPHGVKQLAQEGRWICMDAGDYDHDGDLDIALGNYSRGFVIQQSLKPAWNVRQPIVVLENTTK